MSTVLWANHCINGVVTSDESDKYAMYKHLGALDKLCKSLQLTELSAFCDTTDLRYNMDDEIELPEGMESTSELMAEQGVWLDAAEAVTVLTTLLNAIQQQGTRFGLLKNAHQAVVDELEESIAFAQAGAKQQARFNFCVVM